MKILALVLAVAAVAALLIPSAAGAGEPEGIVPGLEVFSDPGAKPSPRFEQFFKEYRAMVMSWWQHGSYHTTQDKWRAVGLEVLKPGHIIIPCNLRTQQIETIVFIC